MINSFTFSVKSVVSVVVSLLSSLVVVLCVCCCFFFPFFCFFVVVVLSTALISKILNKNAVSFCFVLFRFCLIFFIIEQI